MCVWVSVSVWVYVICAALSYLWSRDCCSVLPLITWLLLCPTSDHVTAALSYLWSHDCCSVLPLITCLLLCPTSDHVSAALSYLWSRASALSYPERQLWLWCVINPGVRTHFKWCQRIPQRQPSMWVLSVCLSVCLCLCLCVSVSLYLYLSLSLSSQNKWINWSFHLQMISEWM